MDQLLSILSDIFKGIKEVTPVILNQTIHAYTIREIARLEVYLKTFIVGLWFLIPCLIIIIIGQIIYFGKESSAWKSFGVCISTVFGILGIAAFLTVIIGGGNYISSYPIVQALNAEPTGALILQITGK